MILVLIVTGLNLNCLILEGFLVLDGILVLALILPARYVEAVLVVTLSFTFFCLMFFAEVTTTRFFAVKGVDSDELTHRDEVVEAECLVELNVYTLKLRDEEVGFEFLADFLQLTQCSLQDLPWYEPYLRTPTLRDQAPCGCCQQTSYP